MPSSPSNHRFTLLSLVPVNDRARYTVDNVINEHTTSESADGVKVLDVGFHLYDNGKARDTLAVLGRGFDVDIYVEGVDIARVQCSFEMNRKTGIVMLYDRSYNNSTQVGGAHSHQFKPGQAKPKVVVLDGLNSEIQMGGGTQGPVIFRLVWHHNSGTSLDFVKDLISSKDSRKETPRHARTVGSNEAETIDGQQRVPHDLARGSSGITYFPIADLGVGGFGTVHKVVDVYSGKLMAMKMVEMRTDGRKSTNYCPTLEVGALCQLKHDHIVEFIASQTSGNSNLEIFMELKEGSLESLIESGRAEGRQIVKQVLKQMLKALSHLASHDIIHRDVKPANILYTTLPGNQYHFQLADFGICNKSSYATTNIGTPKYKAPEIDRNERQTPKADIWSLFVTIAWVLDSRGFRTNFEHYDTTEKLYEKVREIAHEDHGLNQICKTADLNPDNRPTAQELLNSMFPTS